MKSTSSRRAGESGRIPEREASELPVNDAEEAAASDADTAGRASAGAVEETPEVLRERWLRAEADLQNYRRRSQREWEEARRAGEERVMLDVIGALDDLDRALASAGEAGGAAPWVEGVRLVANRLTDALARHGVVPLDPGGERFDPVVHEAMMEMETDAVPPGHVVQVVQRGWRRGDRALRPARVVVARTPEGDV